MEHKILRRCLAGFLVFFALVVAVEAGLRLRENRNRWSVKAEGFQPGDDVVLLIGDSVLGAGRERGMAGFLERELAALGRARDRVVNLSSAANSSERVDERIDADLASYKPKTVVLLLGRSDYMTALRRGTEEPPTADSWWGGLRVVRLVRALTPLWRPVTPDEIARHMAALTASSDLGRQRLEAETMKASADPEISCYAKAALARVAAFTQADDTALAIAEALDCARTLTPPPPDWYVARLQTLIGTALAQVGRDDEALRAYETAIAAFPRFAIPKLELAWLHRKRGLCADAIPLFEDSLRTLPPSARSAQELFLCNEKEKRWEAGAAYFEDLAKRSGDRTPERNFARMLRLRASRKAPARLELEPPRDRAEYLAQLWIFDRRHEDAKIAGLFRQHGRFPVFSERFNREAFRRVIGKILGAGARAVVLQYPNSADGDAGEIARGFPRGVRFLNLSEALAQAMGERPLSDFLQDDFLHLTDEGRRVCAAAVAREVAAAEAAP